ncbi:Vacuolar protein sorting-associated protein 41, partial [Elasticomyces elasticus]
MAWIFRVTPSAGADSMTKATNSLAGTVTRIGIIRLGDCMISGIAMYTPSLMLVLAFMEKKKKKSTKEDSKNTPRERFHHRTNALKPELRLIDVDSKEEIEVDMLEVSRYESLSSSDYHLGVLYPMKIPANLAQKGYLGQLGSGLGTGVNAIGSGVAVVGGALVSGTEVLGQATLDATLYAPRKLGMNRMFSTADTGSIRSGRLGTDTRSPNRTTSNNYLTGWIPGLGSSIFGSDNEELKAVATTTGMKIFMISPFDVIVAVKRTLIDRVKWYEENEQYQKAWELLNEHPEVAASTAEPSEASTPPTPSKASSFAQSDSITSPSRQPPKPTLAEFFADTASLAGSPKPDKARWPEAGEVANKVLNTSTRWEHWAWVFVRNNKFDEISPHLPTLELTPPLPAAIYEIILGHYISRDKKRFQELIDHWPSDLFEISAVATSIRDQLQNGDIREDSDDWRILNECLAKLYLADGQYKEALHCYILLQDADTALTLVKEHHLVEALVDDIPAFVLLRISQDQVQKGSQEELEELSSEPIKLLVDEASLGIISADTIVDQLKATNLQVLLYFYFANLWRGTGRSEARTVHRHRFSTAKLSEDEGRTLVEDHADLAVELFAEYDHDLLMTFLHASTLYDFNKALKIVHEKKYIEEEVYLLSKTGSLKKALYLIIDELQDVSKAIAFAKEQDDQGLWEDMLDYSMSRPQFIAGLLAEVGTAIDPITLVKRIPSGIEIVGLKEGLKKMIREYDLQDSISAGVAK